MTRHIVLLLCVLVSAPLLADASQSDGVAPDFDPRARQKPSPVITELDRIIQIVRIIDSATPPQTRD